ncbi:unnamed protein product [Pieris macdunnoughi]|uniref:PiggyBac transposable element-derived protein domain-containing protein n=1 Tax=Pieris macdunnoughi TaxID=345717 RepID=A0A821T1M0_9NEOP|nr:unnamed protein product [Pieris macdunnoughi]
MDNWFTSVPLAKSLLDEHTLTMVGTLRKNKPEIPKCFLPEKKRETTSSIFGFQKDMTLCSYVPKPRKAVLLLSTMHHDDNVEGINSYVIYKSKIDSNISRRLFIKLLAVDLVKPHQISRASIPTLPRPLQKRLKRQHEIQDQESISEAGRSQSYKSNDHMNIVCKNCND